MCNTVNMIFTLRFLIWYLMQFDINKLVVLHLYNYTKPKGEPDPLSQVEKECQVVKVSTCMRTIYILNSDALTSEKQIRVYQAFVAFLNKKDHYSGATTFERLEGQQAYAFLLYWMIGGVNSKRLFDDTRIIGDVRKIWNKMIVSPSPRAISLVATYKQLFFNLFSDSTQLVKLVKLYNRFEQPEFAEQLKRACQNCSWARVNGFLRVIAGFNYQYFAEDKHLLHLKMNLEVVQQRILIKAQLSPTGDVCFFKSKYEITEEQLMGISQRLKTISSLLQLIQNALNVNHVEEINEVESLAV